jgi:hypothetical protein
MKTVKAHRLGQRETHYKTVAGGCKGFFPVPETAGKFVGELEKVKIPPGRSSLALQRGV